MTQAQRQTVVVRRDGGYAFRPGSANEVASEVDLEGYHPGRSSPERVVVVTCKAWQSGFDATARLAELGEEKANPTRATSEMRRW